MKRLILFQQKKKKKNTNKRTNLQFCLTKEKQKSLVNFKLLWFTNTYDYKKACHRILNSQILLDFENLSKIL